MCIRDSNKTKDDLDKSEIETIINVLSSEAENFIADGKVDNCLLYTSDAADERSSVDLGGRRIIKKKNQCRTRQTTSNLYTRHIIYIYIRSSKNSII